MLTKLFETMVSGARRRPGALPLLVATLLLPAAPVPAGSLFFVRNEAGNLDHGFQRLVPPDFGAGEFTLELWIRLDDAYPVGPTRPQGSEAQRTNWFDGDPAPYGSDSWWFEGNFLLDGHNNLNLSDGTFSLQLYGGGRLRWLFSDGDPELANRLGSLWAVEAHPAPTTPTLLDGSWHQVTLVRRWTGASGATLELWIDGGRVATETTGSRTDLRQAYWDSWSRSQDRWFWGTEKQATLGGFIDQYEDFKGWLDELRFWSLAKSPVEIAATFDQPLVGDEAGLAGWFDFEEGSGASACDRLDSSRCIELRNVDATVWSADNAPLSSVPVIIFRRADTNFDGRLSIGDAITILRAVFLDAPNDDCPDALDTDDDGVLGLIDALAILIFLFRPTESPPPPDPPYPGCGYDPTPTDPIGCSRSPSPCVP